MTPCHSLDSSMKHYTITFSTIAYIKPRCTQRHGSLYKCSKPETQKWGQSALLAHRTVLKTVRKPKLRYYAHGVRQTQLHMDSIVICFITIPIFHNFKLSEASWNLEVQKWWKTVLKIHFLKLYIFWSGSAGKLWLEPGCLLGKAQSKSLKGLAGTWGINHNSWLNFGM